MQPCTLYHICTHANGFENLFQSAENYRYFLKRYEHFISPVADTFVIKPPRFEKPWRFEIRGLLKRRLKRSKGARKKWKQENTTTSTPTPTALKIFFSRQKTIGTF